jgi:hypothetical protein
MSGFCIDGFVGRFAAAHFGQRNAGSPLNVLMRCIQRFLARRAPDPPPPPPAPGAPPPPRTVLPNFPPSTAAASNLLRFTAPSGLTTPSSSPRPPLTRPALASTASARSAPAPPAPPGAPRPDGTASLTSSASASVTTSASYLPSA